MAAADGVVMFNTTSHTAGPDHQEDDKGTDAKAFMGELVAVRKAAEARLGIESLQTALSKDDVTTTLASMSGAPGWGARRPPTHVAPPSCAHAQAPPTTPHHTPPTPIHTPTCA
eukprot:6734522-Prymnesium_polylepis.2